MEKFNITFSFPNKWVEKPLIRESGLLGLALFAILESVCQGVQCHVSIGLLTVVSHQSDPHYLIETEVENGA